MLTEDLGSQKESEMKRRRSKEGVFQAGLDRIAGTTNIGHQVRKLSKRMASGEKKKH